VWTRSWAIGRSLDRVRLRASATGAPGSKLFKAGALCRWSRRNDLGHCGRRRLFRRAGRLPELECNRQCIDAQLGPPIRLVVRAMNLAVVQTAERDREFVADFPPEGPHLSEPQVMRVRGFATADETGSRGH